MFAKHVLRAFDPKTKLKYIIRESVIEDVKTVQDFMDSGLTTYEEAHDGSLIIKDDTIILKVK